MEITDYAFEWAVRNVIQPADTLIVLALIKSSPPSPLNSKPHLQASHRSFHQLFTSMLKKWGRRSGERNRAKKADEGSIKQVNEACVEMMKELCFENNVNHVRTHVIVTVVPEGHLTTVADKADEYLARWVILDRRLKKEGEFCLKQLNCNIILIDHAIPKFLRLLDTATGEELSTTTTDVFPLHRRNNDSTTTSSGHSSSTLSGSVGSSADIAVTIPPPTRRFSPSRPYNYDAVDQIQQEQPKVRAVSRFDRRGTFAKPPTPPRENKKSNASIEKTMPISAPTRRFQETVSPLRRNILTDRISGGCGGGGLGRRSPNSRDASPSSKSPHQISDACPVRTEFDHHHKSAKPPIPVPARTRTVKNASEASDAFPQGRLSVDSRGAKSSMPVRMNSLKELVVEPTPAPVIERTSSIRRAMSISIKQPPVPPPLCSVCKHRAPVFGKPPRKFSYEEVEKATEGFSAANFLAEGGYGSVYKGVLEDGQVVAVKQHKTLSAQGASEFCSEVEVLSCAQHRNLVMLVGYCMEKDWMLLYEFSCNGSLDNHLYGNGIKDVMAWHHRQKVAIGAARGLRYLHEDCRVGCIIHRDLRPNNILLTHDFEPMVGDFGLARWQTDGQLAEETRIVGAFGYLAPEYTQTGQITEKADVYSFGVLLMELISGVKAIDLARCTGLQNLSQWSGPLMDRTMMYGLIDPNLKGNFTGKDVECMMYVASLCISLNPSSRPRMSKVLRLLEGDIPCGIEARQHEQKPMMHFSSLKAPLLPLNADFLSRIEQSAEALHKSSNYISFA